SFSIFVTSVIMALVIQNNLFESRRDDVLYDALIAVDQAQKTLDSADVADDPSGLRARWGEVSASLPRTAASSQIVVFPIGQPPVGTGVRGFTVGGLSGDLLSPGLRERVVAFPDRQSWQSIALPMADGSISPGIVVGQQLFVPEVGAFEVYIAYDLADSEQTLRF